MARIKDNLKPTTAIAVADDVKLPAAPATDNWDAVPETGGGVIVGSKIKYDFNEKVFTIDGMEADPSDTFAVMDAIPAWVKWAVSGNPPLEHRITKPGQYHPKRHEMPDRDESEWQIGRQGKAEDPWKDTRYVLMINTETAAKYTFITDTYGGSVAVSELKDRIKTVRQARPGVIPIVKLISWTMPTGYGIKPRPKFEVVGWSGGSAAPAPANDSKQQAHRYSPDSITSGPQKAKDSSHNDGPPDDGAPPHDHIPDDDIDF